MLSEGFLRDFFGMPKAEKAKAEPAPAPRTVTINCQASDPLDVRAANIVQMIGFQGGVNCFSVPSLSPAEATLRVLKVLRKYQEQDADK